MNIEIKKLNPIALVPKFQTEGSAGADLHACLSRPVQFRPGQQLNIPTGIAIHISDPGVVGLIFPRSGWATKRGIVLSNCTGVIDSDYQGEIIVSLKHQGNETMFINPEDRIAQMVFVNCNVVDFTEVRHFSEESERGSGGFGSTGL